MKRSDRTDSEWGSSSKKRETKKVKMKQLRIGLEAHDYLKNEAFKRDISMKTLVDEIVLEYRDRHQ
ncbi:hypothetical protein LZ578_11995 (plasmid) [Jeotgalibaca sp. MA1X17-3]|uniref:hypothetical protein n=1 Tax=Jeotgalibaca sp. MA1X17-3 TaxID=2908211 RepID=UPI001F3BC89C|nr:hypothetical protein [Jeotgalibaca sp. MA1X17-3]UJF16781.1 hypothetical protein LZ578_11995 [Jeotgalibaca sp. MA1X17-3]